MNTDNPEEGIAPFAKLVGAEVIELILDVAPRKILSRVTKALDHYRKALRLIGCDDEMGAIRLIAAEEELVVAIFEWLKLNAEALPAHRDFIRKSKNHRVKLAFYPVLSKFRFVLEDVLGDGFTLEGLEHVLQWHLSPVRVADRISLRITDGAEKEIITVNPLSLAISSGERSEEEVIEALFRDFTEIVRVQRHMSIREFVTARADYRNKLLYAEDAGYLAMGEDLQTLIDAVYQPTIRDLLWCLAILLTNTPALRGWGLISQFIALYRRVLVESGVLRTGAPELTTENSTET